jgi:hypothetical protein
MDEVVALEREAGAEVGGMPVLSVMRELDVEMMDFLVLAWCVTMWVEVGRGLVVTAKAARAKVIRLKVGGEGLVLVCSS